MEDFEKSGVFYLGKLVNSSKKKLEDELLLYDSKNFTTHAVCVGMTDSGKTGLGITIIEEAALVKHEKCEMMVIKVKEKYAEKIAALTEKVRRAQEKLNQKQQKVGISRWESWISFGATLLGAIFGRKITKGTITGAGTSLKRAGRVTKDSQDAQAAEEDVVKYQEQLDNLQSEMKKEINRALSLSNDVPIEKITIRPRKSDIDIEKVAIAWYPLQ